MLDHAPFLCPSPSHPRSELYLKDIKPQHLVLGESEQHHASQEQHTAQMRQDLPGWCRDYESGTGSMALLPMRKHHNSPPVVGTHSSRPTCVLWGSARAEISPSQPPALQQGATFPVIDGRTHADHSREAFAKAQHGRDTIPNTSLQCLAETK